MEPSVAPATEAHARLLDENRQLRARIAELEKTVAISQADRAAPHAGVHSPPNPAEDALRESEARFRRLMEVSSEIVWITDANGEPVEDSPSWRAFTGRSYDQWAGWKWLDGVHPEDRAGVEAAWRHAVATRGPYRIEFRQIHHSGEYRHIFCQAAPVLNGDGSVREWVGMNVDITKRKQAEQKLRESEQRYRNLFESIDEGFCIIEVLSDGETPVDYRFLEINPAFEQHVGIRGAVGRTVRELVPEIEGFWVETYGRVALTGEPTRCAKYAASLGQWFDVYAFRVGEPREHKVAVLVSNITSRKENEAALGESESRYRALSDLCPDAIFITLEGRFAYANRAAARLLGAADPQDVVGLSPFDRIESRYHDLVRARMRKVLEEGCTVPLVDYVWRRLDGSPLNVEVAGGPISWHGKQAVQIVVRDISERKTAEELLRASERRLTMALESGRMGTWDWTVGTEQVEWSEGHYTLLGYRSGEVASTHENFRQCIHPEDRARQERALRESMEQRREYQCEFRVLWPDESVHWIEARGRYVYDSDGKAVRMYGVLTDIDHKKKFELELLRAKQAAEAANAAKDHFLAVLSHELRTPLAPVLMTASALEHDSSVPEWLREDMSLIRRSVDLEVRLIDDLLDLNRISRGKLELRKQRVGAHDKILAALEICRFDASENGLILEMNLGAERHQVIADPGRLQQVIWNLLKNAIKFTPRGGHVTVRSSNPDADTLRIEVCDTGMGIAPDLLPHLFEAFEQGGKQVTRQFGGMGLGLAISKALTEMQGGRISASSEGPGEGAVFTVDFPVAAAPVEPGRSAERRGIPAARRLRVLLVEDHSPTAQAVDRLLTKAGHEVRAAGSVSEALKVAESYPFDILLSDLGLPDGSGLDVLRELRKQNPQVKAIAMSGFGMEHDLQRSRAAGFAEHLIKPVEFRALEGALTRVAG